MYSSKKKIGAVLLTEPTRSTFKSSLVPRAFPLSLEGREIVLRTTDHLLLKYPYFVDILDLHKLPQNGSSFFTMAALSGVDN